MDHAPPFRADDAAIAPRGSLDRYTSDGVVFGWVWSAHEPNARRRILFFADGEQVAEGIADQPRADLAAAGVGDGAHGFEVMLPDSAFAARPFTVVQVRDAATGLPVGTDLVVDRRFLDRRDPPALSGNLDQVTQDGWVSGWCWYPSHPRHRVELAILVDGMEVGTALAADHRADLAAHGIGDGAHGFAFALPWSVLAETGELTIAVVENHYRTALGAPVTLRIGANAATEARIQDLERQISVLRSEIAGTASRVPAGDEARAARDLFRTVASFFQELANAPPEDGFAGVGLRGALAAFTDRYRPIELLAPPAPEASIILDTRAPIDLVHRCLRAIQATEADRRAEIVLLDDGGHGGEAALLPTIVRNLRYRRIAPGGSLVAARNEAARDARGEAIVFLAGDTLPEPGWLAALLGTLAAETGAALVGARVIGADGMIDHAGLSLDADFCPSALGRGERGDHPSFAFPRPVDAVADRGFAVRAETFRAVGGFSDNFESAAASVIDLCIRLRVDGWSVLYQPAALLTRLAPAPPDPARDATIIDIAGQRRLRLRWRGLSQGNGVGRHLDPVQPVQPDRDRPPQRRAPALG